VTPAAPSREPRPILVLHPSFADAKGLKAAMQKLTRAGYLVVVGDPSRLRALDILPLATTTAIAQKAFEVIAEHNGYGDGPKTCFGKKIAELLSNPDANGIR
jgi:hypothetical protein